MQFIIKAYDGEGMLDKRMEVRPRHLEGMDAMKEHILCGGGMLDDEGKMIGSALIVEFDDRAALDEYIANEPYVQEHVWERIEIERMNVVLLNGGRADS
ncbi:MAG: YciI family protein [Clostridia bacterium]|nr:YciI family protein [Clostridia bacterium]